jgi:hypothetical protein
LEKKEMRKQAIVVLLIAVMGMLSFTILQPAKATPEYSGWDYGYNTVQTLGQNPCYCECNHDGYPGDSADCEAGLGVEVHYCLVGYPQNPMFNYAHWEFEGEVGDGGINDLEPYIEIDPCVNGNGDMWYDYYYPYPDWGPPPMFPNAEYNVYYHWEDMPSSIQPVYSVEGRSIQEFCDHLNPYIIWSIEAKTQNPPDDTDGYGWSYLSATWNQI